MNVGTGRNDAEAAEFLERCHRALRQHTSGNPRPYLDLWSDADDVSLMGGVGGHQVGLEQVSELLLREVSFFAGTPDSAAYLPVEALLTHAKPPSGLV